MAKRIRELIHRRTINSKHWLRDDGKIEAEIYIGPIHYQDEHGKWQDIDTTIEDAQAGERGQGYQHRVVKAPFRAHFPGSAKGPQRFEVPGKGHIIIRPVNVNNSKTQIQGSKATYPDAWDGIDWVRRVYHKAIKSEFIIKSANATNEFRFSISAGGLDYRQLRDGTIDWLRNGKVVARFKRPVVYDAEDQEGKAYQWIGEGQNGLELVLQVDRAWLDDPDRQFPVILDPTTVIQLDPSGKATYVDSYNSDTSHANDQVLRAGADSPYDQCAYDAYVYFDLSSIPANAVVSSATYALYVIGTGTWIYTKSIYLQEIDGDWPENVTYNTSPRYRSKDLYRWSIDHDLPSGWYSWDVTESVVAWTTGVRTNYGFVWNGISSASPQYVRLASDDYSDASKRPKLTVVYNTPPTASSLTPGGSSGSPERVNTTTPRLSWSFSDPDGDSQASFQVIITRDSDGVVVKDTGEVSSSNQYYDVPGGVLAEGQTYRWKVRVKDPGGLWSDYTSEVYIYTNRAPSASPVSPLGDSGNPKVITNDDTPRLQWSFSDPDGDSQAKYRILIKRASDNATIRDTGWVTSSNEYYDVQAGDLTYGVTYYWQVQVEDPYGRQSSLTTAQYFEPNRTAGVPTNLSPGGTSGDPEEVNALTPTLTWTHNDPDSDPQQSFQVLIYRAFDDTLVHDSGEVTSGSSSYNVPGSVLEGSTKYYWKVRTKDTGSGLFGSYSDPVYIYTNQAPYAPTNLTPENGEVFDASASKTFSWEFQDPDEANNGDVQSAYQLLIKRVSDGTTVYDSGKVASSASSHVLPADTLENGIDYQWQVRTWDSQDVVGEYSSLVSIRTGRPPACSITNPPDGGSYGKGVLTVTWSYSDPESDPQVQYQAVLKDAELQVLEDSGILAGDNTEYRFETILDNYSQYTVEVTVWDSTGQSHTASSTFSTDFVPPTNPVLGITEDDAGAKIILTITNPDNDPGKPATSRNHIYRRETGGEWVRIAADLPVNSGYDDYTVASGMEYEYKAVAVSVDETTAESSVQSGSVQFTGVWLHDPVDPVGTTHHFLYDGLECGEDWQPEAEMLRFAGRTLPVIEFGEQAEERVRVGLQMLKNSNDWAVLRALARRRSILCYRDGSGRKVFGVILKLPEIDTHYGQEATFEIIAVDYSEAV